MKKGDETPNDTEMLDEHDFGQGVRGKYVRRYTAGSNVVVLSPDVADAFLDSALANQALRGLISIARNVSDS